MTEAPITKFFPTRPLTNDEVDATRQQIRGWLREASAQAEQQHRPLLIVVGGDHGSAMSALLTAMIHQESRRLGVRDVAFEQPNDAAARRGLDVPISSLKLLDATLLYQLSAHAGDRRHMVDPLTRSATPGNLLLEQRNEAIAANLSAIPRSTLMLAGALHLPGLERRMAEYGTHSVVSFDVSGARVRGQVRTADHIIDLPRDTRHLDDDALLRMALGNRAGDNFISWAERTGNKLSDARRDSRIQHTPAASERDPAAIERSLDALYDAGHFSEAGTMRQRLSAACTGLSPEAAQQARNACSTLGVIRYRQFDLRDSLPTAPLLGNALPERSNYLATVRAQETGAAFSVPAMLANSTASLPVAPYNGSRLAAVIRAQAAGVTDSHPLSPSPNLPQEAAGSKTPGR